ncbi:hypothetical protein NMU03_02830 [Allocoprobacillus halotolerans]|uniref:ABC transporter Uup C-terminal domain-containing protein n=1 Tax=Allocoprobacillus halotolerans TaxID=2944914 RepID=A0ABY5I942_9FIRM|nr:hypothetical protein [Allocoprobacillus halotolerans]UTY40786.1 hypothetical protein NMU03_02830 [Allocoprobacillus halotolerans]
MSQLETQIQEWNSQLQLEDVLNDYKKYNEIIKNIDEANLQLEELLQQWEDMQKD